jgi:hypothetical protein
MTPNQGGGNRPDLAVDSLLLSGSFSSPAFPAPYSASERCYGADWMGEPAKRHKTPYTAALSEGYLPIQYRSVCFVVPGNGLKTGPSLSVSQE